MPEFALTDEQEELQRLGRMLALGELRPQARAAEQSGKLAPKLVQRLQQTGLWTPFPERYGGSGTLEMSDFVFIAEELGFGDAGLAMHIIGSLLAPLAVLLAGSDEQREHYLPLFCAEGSASSLRGSFALAEHIGGYGLADLQTTATFDAQHYLLTGSKRAVIHGTTADIRIVIARDEAIPARLYAFCLPDHVDGLTIRSETERLGLLAAPTASYRFEQAVLPASARLGAIENPAVLRMLALAALLRAAVLCGLTRAALEYAGEYACNRRAFGRRLVSNQSIAFLLVEIAMKLDAVRLLLWSAAQSWDRNDPLALRQAEAAQRQSLQLAKTATTDAVQIVGGAGFMQDHPVEMWMRNAAAME